MEQRIAKVREICIRALDAARKSGRDICEGVYLDSRECCLIGALALQEGYTRVDPIAHRGLAAKLQVTTTQLDDLESGFCLMGSVQRQGEFGALGRQLREYAEPVIRCV